MIQLPMESHRQTPSFITQLSAYKVPLALGSASILLIAFSLILLVKSTQTTTPIQFISATGSGSLSDGHIAVDVAGAVKTPGLYRLPPGSRVEDALTAAGGLAPDADLDRIEKQLNRAAILSDGSKLYIPKAGETQVSGITTQTSHNLDGLLQRQETSQNPSDNLSGISINTASQSELESLPAVGPVTANKIINNRPYQSIDELVTKKVVGQSTFGKIKDLISL